MTMQQGTCAQRFGSTMSPRRGCRYAIAFMAIALLVAVPFVAGGQGTGQGTVQVNPAASGAPAAPAASGAAATPSESAQPGANPGAASNVPAASVPASSATAAPASAALPGEHMIS